MRIAERTISALAKLVTGDAGKSPRLSGPHLVELFNAFGSNDVYGSGFPSRWKYAEEKIRELNGTNELAKLIVTVLHPGRFLETPFSPADACAYINQWLKYDHYEVDITGGIPQIHDFRGTVVPMTATPLTSNCDLQEFIQEQMRKAETKIQNGDYDGAITNARSLVEGVLQDIEADLTGTRDKYDGDLPKLYTRVQKLLKLHSDQNIKTPLNQVLTGLSSIVTGISGISNNMGDRHARIYKPSKHHAVLTVNAANTLANFLYDAWRYQKDSDKLA